MITKQYDLGLKDLVTYRPYTEDENIIRSILIDRTEYHLFLGCNPSVIFDVGGNIGAAAILFANSYPNAMIYSFEPEPGNFELLKANTMSYKNIKIFPFALGGKTENRSLMASDDEYNFGGFSFHPKGSDPDKSIQVECRDVAAFIQEMKIEKIDLMKVDTEGCEKEILFRLSGCSFLPDYIMGEAHGAGDGTMFDFLEESHAIKINRDFGQRCYPFYAARRPA